MLGKEILGSKYSELQIIKMNDFDFSEILGLGQLTELIKKVALPIEIEEARVSRLIKKSKFLQKQSNELQQALKKGTKLKIERRREALHTPEEFTNRNCLSECAMDRDRGACLENFLEKKKEGKSILDSYTSERSGYFPVLISNNNKKIPQSGDNDISIVTRKGYRNIDTTKNMILKD